MSFSLTTWEQRTLQFAKDKLGQREATGHNDGKLPHLVQRFIAAGAAWLDNQPWCACFAIWCIYQAAGALKLKPSIPKTASSSALYAWYRHVWHGLLEQPHPGCVGMVRGGRTGHRHTFLVHDVEDRLGRSVLRGTLDPAAVGPACFVVGVDGNLKNAVGWSRRPVSACDYGPIC